MFSMTASKSNYFDGALIQTKVAEANRRVFGRFGGYVRKVAKTSIKKAPKIDVVTGQRLGPGRRKKGVVTRDAIADVGKPPYAHLGTIGQMLFYAVEPESVVIGPERAKAGTLRALEEGGEITIGPKGRRKGRQVTLGKHPFMQPAFQLGLGQLMEWYKDSVK